MPFPFHLLCDLLSELERNHTKSSSLIKAQELDARTLAGWFDKHDEAILRWGPEAVAFLSCLFPERRPDRVFGLSRRQLQGIIQRAQCLGSSRMKELQRWQTTNGPSLASCVERVMAITDCEPRIGPTVTLRELDCILDRLAALSPFSSDDLRNDSEEEQCNLTSSAELLSGVFRRLRSNEAKWLVRMLSKNYSPARIPDMLAMRRFHPLLSDLLRFQNSIPAATRLLGRLNTQQTPIQAVQHIWDHLWDVLQPQVGVMIARPAYEKARSIRHCCQLARLRRMSVERKYDGEYCQIHVDLSNRESGIKIFSKGGRDSTRDRMGLHRALRESLKLGTADCAIKKQCILEGELLVWNDDTRTIAPFHRIRKHVRRSGRLLGAAQDSPVTANEHLMVMFYDLLLLDDTFCARESLDKRRHRLQSLVCRISGHADIGSREVVTFSSTNAAEELTAVFARAITQRWEGLVLKGCDDPYFTFDNSKLFIKLKKDYIPGLGDSADFIIVGGHYNTDDEHDIGMGKLWWTAFYIGCVDNKDEVYRFNAKPRIRVIDIVDKYGISKDHIVLLNRQGYFTRMPFAMSTPNFDVVLESAQRLRPVELFTHPYIVELVGAGFDKPANTAYYTLRFPRVLKIHDDRSFGDTISFKELQEMAQNCLAMPEKAQREEKYWRERLCGQPQIDEEGRNLLAQ